MGKTDSRQIREFLVEISGYALQCKDDPLTFQFVIADNHQRSLEVMEWLNLYHIDIKFLDGQEATGIRYIKVAFPDRYTAALFKMRFA